MGMENVLASPRKRRKLSKESYLENEEFGVAKHFAHLNLANL